MYCTCRGLHKRAYTLIDAQRNYWGCGTCLRPGHVVNLYGVRHTVAQEPRVGEDNFVEITFSDGSKIRRPRTAKMEIE